MLYNVSIEGQTIQLPEAIATDDAKVRQALAPYFPGAAESLITRKTEGETTTISVVKKAGSKGQQSYAGADWIKKCEPWKSKKQMSPIGEKAANLLGNLYQGIYHIDREALKVDWANPHYIEIVVRDNGWFGTYDAPYLTRLVLLAHAMNIKVTINAAAPHYFRLLFHEVTLKGFFSDHHPTLDEAISNFKEEYANAAAK